MEEHGTSELLSRQTILRTRQEWIPSLPLERPEEVLFELDTCLRALTCFFNPRNQPFVHAQNPLAHDWRDALEVVREVIDRIVELAYLILGKELQESLSFARFLRVQSAGEVALRPYRAIPPSPGEALRELITNLLSYSEVAAALCRCPYASLRLFTSLGHLMDQTIRQSVYFNPAVTRKVQPGLERIRLPLLNEIVRELEDQPLKRLISALLVACFRGLRYLTLAQNTTRPRISLAILALLRVEARGMTGFIEREVSQALSQVRDERPWAESLDCKLRSMASQARLEQEKIFSEDLASRNLGNAVEISQTLQGAIDHLRHFFQHSIALIVREFRPLMEGQDIFEGYKDPALRSSSLRRDLWILKELVADLVQTIPLLREDEGPWQQHPVFRKLSNFVVLFRRRDYSLLHLGDHQLFDRFLHLLRTADQLALKDSLPSEALIKECLAFAQSLEQTFQAVSRRAELTNRPFDLQEAQRALGSLAEL